MRMLWIANGGPERARKRSLGDREEIVELLNSVYGLVFDIKLSIFILRRLGRSKNKSNYVRYQFHLHAKNC